MAKCVECERKDMEILNLQESLRTIAIQLAEAKLNGPELPPDNTPRMAEKWEKWIDTHHELCNCPKCQPKNGAIAY